MKRRLTTTVAVGAAAALVLAGCSAGPSGAGSASTGSCEPADGPVDLSITTWLPGVDKAVERWNELNPDVQVSVKTGPSGNAGTYQNLFNQLKAGDAPDLAQVEYDALASFRVQDGLQDVGACDGLADAGADFVDWTWEQVTFGEEGAVYAVPQDSGPMAMYYRKDLFEKAGIPVPTTWEEYHAAAEAIRAQGGYIHHFPQSDVNWFAGLVWQAGGSWFADDGEAWDVSLTDPASVEVADYWQGLLDDGLVVGMPGWSDEWNNALNTGQQWTWLSAVWGANTIADGAPDTAGQWAVAPMPQWDADQPAAGNWGGSSVAILKGTEHPYEAAAFARWLNSDPEALAILNEEANIYPAAVAGADLPALTEGVEFYGGQKIYDEFATAADETSADFVFGPTMTQTYNDVADGFGDALGGKGTLADALAAAEDSTVSTMESQSIPVSTP